MKPLGLDASRTHRLQQPLSRRNRAAPIAPNINDQAILREERGDADEFLDICLYLLNGEGNNREGNDPYIAKAPLRACNLSELLNRGMTLFEVRSTPSQNSACCNGICLRRRPGRRPACARG